MHVKPVLRHAHHVLLVFTSTYFTKHYAEVAARIAITVWTLLSCLFFYFIPFISDRRPPTDLSIARTRQAGVYNVLWTAPQGSTVGDYKIQLEDLDEDVEPTKLLAGSAATKYVLDLSQTEPGVRYAVSVQPICGGQAGERCQSVSLFYGRRSELTGFSFYKDVITI